MSGGTLTNHLLGFSSILDEIVREYSPSVSGAFLSSVFQSIFGLRAVPDMPVLRDFPSSGVDLWTVFDPFLAKSSSIFHRVAPAVPSRTIHA